MSLDFREMTRAQLLAIGKDIVRASGHGDPQHFKLVADINRAYFLALNSPTFRKLVAPSDSLATAPTTETNAASVDQERR